MTCTVCHEESDRVDANGVCDACNLEALRMACEGRGWDSMMTGGGYLRITDTASDTSITLHEARPDRIVAVGGLRTVVSMLRLLEEHGVGR